MSLQKGVTIEDFWQTGLDWLLEALREVRRDGTFRPPLTREKLVALHKATTAALASLRELPPEQEG
jgi:hypothetical protein